MDFSALKILLQLLQLLIQNMGNYQIGFQRNHCQIFHIKKSLVKYTRICFGMISAISAFFLCFSVKWELKLNFIYGSNLRGIICLCLKHRNEYEKHVKLKQKSVETKMQCTRVTYLLYFSGTSTIRYDSAVSRYIVVPVWLNEPLLYSVNAGRIHLNMVCNMLY